MALKKMEYDTPVLIKVGNFTGFTQGLNHDTWTDFWQGYFWF